MNSEQLRLFIQVAQHSSLTKAALAANSAQSVISRQLSALERECGGRLFYRTGRGVTLTELGATFLPRVKEILEQLDQLSDSIRSSAGVPTGEVRLGILPALSLPLVSTLTRQTRERYPSIRLHLFEGSNGQLQEWIDSRRIDLALMYRYGEVNPSVDRVVGTAFAYLIGAAGDKVTHEPTIAFERLQQLPLVLPGVPNALRTTLDAVAKRENVSLNVILEADSLPIQKRIAADGVAYAIVGRLAVTEELKLGSLQASRIIDPPIERVAILAAGGHGNHGPAVITIAQLLEPLAIGLLEDR
jgi:LysR family transcriptional regulator, nitrogen assimilation regulatory protein